MELKQNLKEVQMSGWGGRHPGCLEQNKENLIHYLITIFIWPKFILNDPAKDKNCCLRRSPLLYIYCG